MGTGPRFIAYVDGFNLYHAIDDLNEPHLKWLDVSSLCRGLAMGLGGRRAPGASLVAVKWFTAYPDDPAKAGSKARHLVYQAALEALGTQTILGKFRRSPDTCKRCGYRKAAEKETDVNIALEMAFDADRRLFDCALLVTGDSDQVPTVRRVVSALGPGSVHIVVPPNRGIPYELMQVAGGPCYVKKLRVKHIRSNQLPEKVLVRGGSGIDRPAEYASPMLGDDDRTS